MYSGFCVPFLKSNNHKYTPGLRLGDFGLRWRLGVDHLAFFGDNLFGDPGWDVAAGRARHVHLIDEAANNRLVHQHVCFSSACTVKVWPCK